MAICEPPLPLTQEKICLVFVGHVDHGKSTVVGRLLADTGSLPQGRLEEIRAFCQAHSRQFEYAYVLDALRDERAQGITIDAARISFHSSRRHYTLIDAPGHIEFLRNMVTGAARAEAAVLVIDAAEGVAENSRRHAALLPLLGLDRVLVLINKMDLVGYSQEAFQRLARSFQDLLARLGVQPEAFIPVSGLAGDNIVSRSARMPWYQGDPLLAALDRLPCRPAASRGPFRMFVQDIYRFTRFGDNRRLVVGTIDCGRLEEGDEVHFYPSGKRTRVRSLERFQAVPRSWAAAGEAVAFTVEPQIYVTRGELVARRGEPQPRVSTLLRASLFWLGRQPLRGDRAYLLRLGTARAQVRLQSLERVVDAGTLEALPTDEVGTNQVAEATLRLSRALAFDEAAACPPSGRFVILDDYRIVGGGLVRQALPDPVAPVREQVFARERKWIPSLISPLDRAERYGQRPLLLLITGETRSDRKTLARLLERRLFADGRLVYFLAIGSVLHGLDADIEGRGDAGREHIRRLAEVANLFLDAGMLLIVSAARLTQGDLELIGEHVGREKVQTLWYGGPVTTDLPVDLHLPEADLEAAVDRAVGLLCDQGVLFNPSESSAE
ncbi:MAG TPA: GTP-binding protein [Candidatus Nitrosotenuis sp.]|nr:GTP-binding protein [Candidatus Nitrosotenuis sp.]